MCLRSHAGMCVTLKTVGICNYCVGANLAADIWGTIYLDYGPTTYSQSFGLQKYPRHLEMTHTKLPVTDVAVHLCTAQEYNNGMIRYEMQQTCATGVTKKHHSSILLEAVSPKYKCTASVWIVCNTMSLSHPESLDRSSHGYFQILLDTDESPALTLHTCTGPVAYADR